MLIEDMNMTYTITPICKKCGEECRVIQIDNGIGQGEAFGLRYAHKEIIEVSDCCQADYNRDELPYWWTIHHQNI